jgi:YggT family protein
MIASLLVVASTRAQIADFLNALILVYVILIIAYILMTLFLQFGGRVPYSRWSRAIMDFLSETVEPYLGFFRRFIPPFGPLDVSPIVALLVLQIGGRLITSAIAG